MSDTTVDRRALSDLLRTLAAHLAAPEGPADDSHDPHALITAATLLRTRAAEVNPDWCPPACGSAHTYAWPCGYGPATPTLLPKRALLVIEEFVPANDLLVDVEKSQATMDAIRARGDSQIAAVYPDGLDGKDAAVEVIAVTGTHKDGMFTETAPAMATHARLVATWVARV